MVATEFIVAIELGSSKMIGIAGQNLPDGTIQVLAISSRESTSFIRKGKIYNLDKTAYNLTLIIKELEETLKATINKVYVGIGGQSLQTLANTEVVHFEEETKVSQELINTLIDRNTGTPIAEKDILEVIPQEYKLGINSLTEPVGVTCTRLEANFLNIVARNSLKQNIDSCFRQARIKIADYAIAPLALANLVLLPNERRSGCALVDFGADTTTVCVYKNNILRHLAVIPLGGSNITKDLCSQKLEEEEAEKLKILYANAYTNPSNKEEESGLNYALEGKRPIAEELFNDIVEGRVTEILINVLKQIELSGYRDKLLEGVVFTGGSSGIKNIARAFQQLSNIERVRVEKGSQVIVEAPAKINKNEISNLALAILHYGKENCCKPEVKVVPPKVEEKKVEKVEKIEKVVTEEPKSEPLQFNLFNEEKIEVVEKTKEEMLPPVEVVVKPSISTNSDNDDLTLKTHRCDLLIKKATMKKQNGQFEEALREFEEALALNISDRTATINQHIEEIKHLTKNNSWFGKVKSQISRWSDSITEEH
ncbi:MAG: cell division protein FtsA [Phocaeicola sp.]